MIRKKVSSFKLARHSTQAARLPKAEYKTRQGGTRFVDMSGRYATKLVCKHYPAKVESLASGASSTSRSKRRYCRKQFNTYYYENLQLQDGKRFVKAYKPVKR